MIQILQTTAIVNGASSQNPTLSFTNPVMQGSCIVVCASTGGPGAPIVSVTDNQTGNTYTRAVTMVSTAGGTHVEMFYAQNVNSNGGTFTVTANFSSSSIGCDWMLYELDNVDQVAALSAAVSTTGTSTTPTSPLLSPKMQNCLVIAQQTDDAGGDTTTMTNGAGFTLRATQLVISTRERIGIEDKIQNSQGVAASFTIGQSVSWAIGAAAFKPADTNIGNRYRYGTVGTGMSRSEGWT